MFNFWLYCLVVVQTTKMQIIKVSEVKTLNTYGQTPVCCGTVLMSDQEEGAASPVISCVAEVSVAASCGGLTERQPWCH